MASAEKAIKRLMKWEGWSLENVSGDSGGLTCCGISRVYHPTWPGWGKIDKMVEEGAVDLEKVREDVYFFYGAMFFPYEPLAVQSVADQVFQARVNCGNVANKWAQKVCNDMGSNLVIDGIFGEKTQAETNKHNSIDFMTRFYEHQIQYYDEILKHNPTQEKFRRGWYARALDFT